MNSSNSSHNFRSSPATSPAYEQQNMPASNSTFNSFNARQSAFQPSHSHSQSTSVLLNSSSRSGFRSQSLQQQQQQNSSNRSVSMRPMSAFQPLDNPDYYNAGATSSPTSPRPPSPTGSTARSIRSTANTPLTFKSQDLRSALSLQESQQKKLYMEGYLLKRDDLGTDGKPLNVADDKRRWSECFVQLSGTVLSLWNVQQMEEAATRGTEVPPTYINITDSFVDFIGLLIEDPKQIPGSRGRYHHAFAINSAGNNRTIFCFRDPPPFPPDSLEQYLAPEHRNKPEHRTVIGWLNLGHRHLQAWINAIRLASWEKVRLEEIYTGALIRARLGAVGGPASAAADAKQAPAVSASDLAIKSPLVKGKMEGWVKARFMGSTEWKKVWMVLTDHKPDESEFGAKKKFWKIGSSAGDRSSVMSVNSVSTAAPGAPGADGKDLPPPPGSNGAPGVASFFESKKDKKPFASLIYAAHAFAVYPSRPELVEGSSLFKIEGVFPNSTVLSATHRVRTTGWVMLMPELDTAGSKGANAEMMKWIIAFMDAFKLYGRPDAFVWEARDPVSPFFAYPIGPFKDRLFLDRELAEFLEIAREDHLTTRSALHGIMAARMRGERTKILQPLPPPSQNTVLPTRTPTSVPMDDSRSAASSNSRLPPLDFAASQPAAQTAAPALAPTQQQQHQHEDTRELPAELPAKLPQTFKDSARGDARNDDEARPASPDFDGYRPPRETRPGQMPPTYPGAQTQAATATAAVPAALTPAGPAGAVAPVSLAAAEPLVNRAPVVAPQTATIVSNDAHAAPAAVVQPTSQPAAATSPIAQQPTHAQESSLAYLGSSSASHATSPTVASEPAAARPAPVFGPSGRGAQQTTSDDVRGSRRESLPTNYDESALFYMASISDQLPAATAQPVVMSGPSRAVVTKESSLASRPQSLAPASGTTSAIQSESTHTTRLSSDQTQAASVAAPALPATIAAVVPAQDHHVKSVDQPVSRANQTADDSINDDALAAYSFLEQPPSPALRTAELAPRSTDAERSPVPSVTAPVVTPTPPVSTNETASFDARPAAVQYPSTFGQNKRAAERKSIAQMQAQAHQEALSKPGRAGGAKPKGLRRPGWVDDSEEEEDDEEEDEEEDDAADAAHAGPGLAGRAGAGSAVRSAASSSRGAPGTDSPVNLADSVGSLGRSHDAAAQPGAPGAFPRSASGYGASVLGGSRSASPGQSPARPGMTHPSIQAYQRQSMFNTHLAAAHGDDGRSHTPPQAPQGAQGPIVRDRQTFLQLNPEEQPGAMTTVFTPHGLVQAGAQDKAERSAKAQEAEARAMGGHLVNVPNKPPPPQAGLLGAITAHERDRKGAGGFGATLTERERERVAAERRQRDEDAARQQAQQMQQQHLQQMAYFNPMMYQQMMMSGMMGGMGGMGMMGMGMPGMNFGGSQMGSQGGFDPMMAQQQAMQAAQMAYMNALQQAHEGSVVGHGSPAQAPASAMGGQMPFMASPHMSMMGAPYGFIPPSGVGNSEYNGATSPNARQNKPGQN